MSNLILVHLETVLVSVQDRCTVCYILTMGSGIVLDAPDVLLGDEIQVEHGLCQTYHRLRNHFGCTRWYS
jgi:hypothetical protein